MRKLLNTLYITTPKSYLALDGENLVVLLEENEKFRLPFINIESIVCFGYMGASPALMGKCADNNVALSFLKPNGEFLARVTGKTKGSVYLRKKQYTLSDNVDFCLQFAQKCVAVKLGNTCTLLNRAIRENKDKMPTNRIEQVAEFIEESITIAARQKNIEAVMGIEGLAAKRYFEVFDDLILAQKKQFHTKGRSKRPPTDYVNCMLSYLYTILNLEYQSALETVGLDPCVGFMHSLRAGRASLACDLVEETRAYLVDRTVLSMVNLHRIEPEDFIEKEGGAVLFTEDGRKKILSAWQERKKEIITHNVIDEKIELGLLPYVQAQLLARYIRGDLPEYHAFKSR